MHRHQGARACCLRERRGGWQNQWPRMNAAKAEPSARPPGLASIISGRISGGAPRTTTYQHPAPPPLRTFVVLCVVCFWLVGWAGGIEAADRLGESRTLTGVCTQPICCGGPPNENEAQHNLKLGASAHATVARPTSKRQGNQALIGKCSGTPASPPGHHHIRSNKAGGGHTPDLTDSTWWAHMRQNTPWMSMYNRPLPVRQPTSRFPAIHEQARTYTSPHPHPHPTSPWARKRTDHRLSIVHMGGGGMHKMHER